MDGMKSKKTAKVFLGLFLISAVLSLPSCARHKVPSKQPPRLPKKEIDRKGVYHVVERHQTLYRICKTYGVNINEVASVNEISDHHKIQVGQRILIPGAKKVLKVEIYIDDVVEESEEKGKEKIVYPKSDFIWPVLGPRTAGFDDSDRNRHQGIDISSPLGTSIKASNSGVVVYSGDTIRGYGNLIILRHPGEWVTVYAHNQANLVEEGASVEKGQVIAKVGQTGRATGSHLHFEVRRNNKAVDPMLLLK
jgi:murein DD-endopeptidase MepM/ murein hydrolase activator NlpD